MAICLRPCCLILLYEIDRLVSGTPERELRRGNSGDGGRGSFAPAIPTMVKRLDNSEPISTSTGQPVTHSAIPFNYDS